MASARYIPVPEAHSTYVALCDIADTLCSDRQERPLNPLFIHGPSGVGKSLLISELGNDVMRRSPRVVIASLPAADFFLGRGGPIATELDAADFGQRARAADLVVIEDLQQLRARGHEDGRCAFESFVQLLDDLRSNRQQMILTASVGPGLLERLPNRLISRLCSGLVVSIAPLCSASRLALLQTKAQRRQLAVNGDILRWIAENTRGGGRQIEGALVQLETLSRMRRDPLTVDLVARHFHQQAASRRPTMERIAAQVGSYFRVEPSQLQSQQRFHKVLVPRQVGMYLARQLTDLSLDQIGAYFGNRDHTTVLHACRKIQEALPQDARISGAVRQLQTALE